MSLSRDTKTSLDGGKTASQSKKGFLKNFLGSRTKSNSSYRQKAQQEEQIKNENQNIQNIIRGSIQQDDKAISGSKRS